MRSLLAVSALAAALAGCANDPPARGEDPPPAETHTRTLSIKVGAPWERSVRDLAAVGAKETELALAGGDAERSVAYELPDGRLLIMSGSRDAVSSLQQCNNPDEPKADREWDEVEEVVYRPLH